MNSITRMENYLSQGINIMYLLFSWCREKMHGQATEQSEERTTKQLVNIIIYNVNITSTYLCSPFNAKQVTENRKTLKV